MSECFESYGETATNYDVVEKVRQMWLIQNRIRDLLSEYANQLDIIRINARNEAAKRNMADILVKLEQVGNKQKVLLSRLRVGRSARRSRRSLLLESVRNPGGRCSWQDGGLGRMSMRQRGGLNKLLFVHCIGLRSAHSEVGLAVDCSACQLPVGICRVRVRPPTSLHNSLHGNQPPPRRPRPASSAGLMVLRRGQRGRETGNGGATSRLVTQGCCAFCGLVVRCSGSWSGLSCCRSCREDAEETEETTEETETTEEDSKSGTNSSGNTMGCRNRCRTRRDSILAV